MAEFTKVRVWSREPIGLGAEGVCRPGEPAEVIGRSAIWQLLSSPSARSYVRIDCFVGSKEPSVIWTSDATNWTKVSKVDKAALKAADELVETFAKDHAEAEKARIAADKAADELEAKHLEAAASHSRKRGHKE